ncbi:MAG TPA: FG-GAP-like repeat-containing protein, partial [Steroidobacteraceae bacterium]
FTIPASGSLQGTISINFNSLNTVATTALVNNVLEHISYKNLSDTPPDNVTMHFTFNDGNIGGAQGSGGQLSDTANRTIDITAVNDAPVASGGNAGGNEDTAISGQVPAASDVDSGTLTYALVGTNGGAGHGTVVLNTNGGFTYTPAADFNGTDSFSFQASDGALLSNVATENLTIAAVNDAPVITSNGGDDAASVSVAEHTSAVTTVHATDIDSPTLTYAISGGADQAQFNIDASNGVLTFAAAADFAAPADANHDNTYVVQVSASDGTLTDTQTLSVSVTNAVDVMNTDSGFNGDVSGDHKSDLIIRDSAGGVTLWQMNGGTIQSQQSIGAAGNEWHIESNADFGGDGKADILWRADDGSVALWQMNGAQIVSNTGLGKAGNEWHINGTGDFNGDGKADILWHADNGSVAIWQMNGAEIAGSQPVGAVGPEQHVVGIGDFNGDHNSDILWRADDGSIALWQMNGDQLAANVNVGKVGLDWHVEGIGDFNGDGQADILFRSDNGTLATWQMSNGQIQSSQIIGAVGPEWHVSGTADLDGDGKADILFRNSDGSVAAWQMNATQIAVQDAIGPLAIDATFGAHHYDLV